MHEDVERGEPTEAARGPAERRNDHRVRRSARGRRRGVRPDRSRSRWRAAMRVADAVLAAHRTTVPF